MPTEVVVPSGVIRQVKGERKPCAYPGCEKAIPLDWVFCRGCRRRWQDPIVRDVVERRRREADERHLAANRVYGMARRREQGKKRQHWAWRSADFRKQTWDEAVVSCSDEVRAVLTEREIRPVYGVISLDSERYANHDPFAQHDYYETFSTQCPYGPHNIEWWDPTGDAAIAHLARPGHRKRRRRTVWTRSSNADYIAWNGDPVLPDAVGSASRGRMSTRGRGSRSKRARAA